MNMRSNSSRAMEEASQIETPEAYALIARSCALLDAEKFDDWLNLCAAGFSYEIATFSQELGREMSWLDQGRDELAVLFKGLNSHVRTPGPFFRHLGAVIQSVEGKSNFQSTVVVYHTSLRGESSLFALCRYFDEIRRGDDGALSLVSRKVWLDTRLLSFGSHLIL